MVDENGDVTIAFTEQNVKPVTCTIKAGRSITGYETKKDEETGDILLTFTYSDGTKSDPVRIPKGDKGDPGRGIKDWKCEKTEIGGQKVTITFSDDTTQEFILDPGNGISSITSSINEDGEWELQIYYTNGNSDTLSFAAQNTWLSSVSSLFLFCSSVTVVSVLTACELSLFSMIISKHIKSNVFKLNILSFSVENLSYVSSHSLTSPT